MEKTIYQLLNEVETDFDEYEQTELTPQEKEIYKQRILAEVKSMKMRERNKKKIWQKALGLAAACAVVIGAAGMAANPVLAKQLFSAVFGKILTTSTEYAIGQKELTGKVAMKASTIQEELSKQQNQGGYAASAECNGITLAVSDVYCDGSMLYYTLVVWTDNADMNKAESVFLYLQDGELNTPILEGSDGECVDAVGGTISSLKKADDGSYVCMNELNLYNLTEEEREKLQIEDGQTLNVRYELDGLTGVTDIEQMDEQRRCKETARVEGEWNLRFPVTVEASGKEVIEINKEENGIIVKSIIKTDTTLTVEVDYSGYATKPPYDYKGCPVISITDSEGNGLKSLGGSGNGNSFTMLQQVVYDGQKNLIIYAQEYISETDESVEIAEIPVQLP